MTENEAIIQLNFDMEMIRFNPSTGESLTLEQIKAHNEDNYKTYLADELAITALLEIQQYRAIGTVEGYENAIKAYTETYILMKEYKSKLQDFEAIGTIEEFKALKEADMRGANRAVEEFANYLHKIAKENNGLRLSSETRSWTHPCIFDYLKEFKEKQIFEEET